MLRWYVKQFQQKLHTVNLNLKMSSSGHNNRLINEKSPYLLQHAHNPVDWYPWGEEAFERARSENKIIFLSVGYSTCHWCHVMEHESFENESIAKIMNELFVNIKVDREERPDVDKVYMTFVQATTGGGGWPMSVFLTPDLKPIVGGTYFPPEDSAFGRPGFATVLKHVARQWHEKRDDLLMQSSAIMEAIHQSVLVRTSTEFPDAKKVTERCYEMIADSFDPIWGGFGQAPKFPQPVNFDFMFRFYYVNNLKSGGKTDGTEMDALGMCKKTLLLMQAGGIHDHVGNGFHRYSTDRKWHVPHFEKMLYDQAQLATSYAELFQLTRDTRFSNAVEDILLYVSRDLSNPDGGFYSGEDADSLPTKNDTKKKEGAFCVWTENELRSHLSDAIEENSKISMADVFIYHYGVKKNGNVDPHQDPHGELTNQNVLIVFGSTEKTAEKFGLEVGAVDQILARCRNILFDIRQNRPKPHRDTKIITAWNGLMISGFAHGGIMLNDEKWVTRAVKAAEFIRQNLYLKETDNTGNYLLRSCYADENEALTQIKRPVRGFAEDYAFLIAGLLDLYDACFNDRWIEWAIELQDNMDRLFWDEKDGGYFHTTQHDKSILVRMKHDQDGAEPSENSMAAVNLVRLGSLLNEKKYLEKAKQTVKAFGSRIERVPLVLPKMLCGVLQLSYPNLMQIIVISGKGDLVATEMIKYINSLFLPFKVFIWLNGESGDYLKNKIPYLASMKLTDGKPYVYICQNYACSMPICSIEELKEKLVM